MDLKKAKMKRRQQQPKDEWVTGKVALSISGSPLEVEMTVPAFPVKQRRMLPILQQITNSFIEIGLSEMDEGEEVSCRAGCGACCRQVVPIAESEAYNLAELVRQMPDERRREVERRFAEGIRHFQENNWFEKFDGYPKMSHEEKQQLALEYLVEGVACPFLENESCSIHPDRPLSCREYLVTSPPENCSSPSGENIRQVHFKARPSIALLEMETTAHMKDALFVPMIAALDYAEKFRDTAREKDGRAWMTEFFGNLTHSGNDENQAKNLNL